MNNDWLACFPRVIQTSLPRLGSNHVLIRLEVGTHSFNQRPFRFEIAWTTKEGFQDLVYHLWIEFSPVGCGAFIFSSKNISRVRAQLRH